MEMKHLKALSKNQMDRLKIFRDFKISDIFKKFYNCKTLKMKL